MKIEYNVRQFTHEKYKFNVRFLHDLHLESYYYIVAILKNDHMTNILRTLYLVLCWTQAFFVILCDNLVNYEERKTIIYIL